MTSSAPPLPYFQTHSSLVRAYYIFNESTEDTMSYRALWIVAIAMEAVLMVIGLVFIGADGSLGVGIAWIATQMPAHAISNWIIAEHFVSDVPFFALTFVLQSALFGSVLCLLKWARDKLAPLPPP